ncbi:MAG: hypothetical protein A2622_01220 [Bdellovibrionales bacterium RIFCSPHIGHO2_01_FULL_40_29]|nr:MAG: hypothetical protein A2622_01220 [Bdellovibrionales bacterium RIFCSPHIGHO2_01_FULL_40_29]OFZ32733.1 MAG: hypothetical protein A3D17_05820 [Bdellovibrionales bacterium RIFCSPHIGHO2_02_FULL_40_15]
MIEKMLSLSVENNGHQISFVVGQKILSKTGLDWVEMQNSPLKIDEWEDLKELCLQPGEKIQLETKGFVSGLYHSQANVWKFTFVERKDCFRAFMALAKSKNHSECQIQNPLFWDLLKKDKGIFIFAGPRRSGKSSLIAEILEKKQNEKVNLIGIHAHENDFQWPALDNIIQLGADTIDWETNHLIYDGLETVVLDFNYVKKWEKWIELAEQGRAVYLTTTAESVQIVFQQCLEKLTPGLMFRFLTLLNGIAVQKLVGAAMNPIYELLLLRQGDRDNIFQLIQAFKTNGLLDLSLFSKESYQSLNQSIIHNLIRRQFDVKTAFSASDQPEQLDEQLKKMGL